MSFRVFPVTITPDGRKVPLIREWREKATTDPKQMHLWQELFRDRLHYWGIPTGKDSDLLVLDADPKHGGLDTLKTLNIPETMSQQTRSGGKHFLFRYPRDGKKYGNRVGFLPGLDIRADGGFIVHYGVDSKLIVDAPTWLLELTEKPDYKHEGDVVKVMPEIAEGIIGASLEAIREAPPGESNNVLNIEAFKIGQLVASQSITREYAERALMEAAIERGKPRYEAQATIASGLDGGSKKPIVSPFSAEQPKIHLTIPEIPNAPGRWTPNYFTKYDLLNTSKLRKPQLFESWSAEDITITTADGGTGKTTLKLYEAICLALGDRFLGFDCKNSGKTLFITGEDTDKKLAAMLGAIMRQMGLFEEGIGNESKVQTILSSIVIKKDADLCLIQKDKQGFLTPNSDSFRKVLEAVEDIRPKMIVFDPISSFWGSEAALNDMSKAVTKFMSELAEKSGAAVEMINHMGKQSSAQKDMTQFAGRGGTGLPSNARISRVLRPVSDQEYTDLTGETLGENQSAMICNVNKFSDGSALYNKPFMILREGYLFTRKILTNAKAKEIENTFDDTERVFTFVKEARDSDRYPTLQVIIGNFAYCNNPISEAKVKRAVNYLVFNGHLGDKLKYIDNPDLTAKDKALVIIDSEGREI